MPFVWVHVAIFAFWVATGLFGADPYPFQFLTFMVSLEAIFLSTFVMIGQNRQSTFQQAKADRDFHEAGLELKRNTELTRFSPRDHQSNRTARMRATPPEPGEDASAADA